MHQQRQQKRRLLATVVDMDVNIVGFKILLLFFARKLHRAPLTCVQTSSNAIFCGRHFDHWTSLCLFSPNNQFTDCTDCSCKPTSYSMNTPTVCVQSLLVCVLIAQPQPVTDLKTYQELQFVLFCNISVIYICHSRRCVCTSVCAEFAASHIFALILYVITILLWQWCNITVFLMLPS